MSVFVAGTSYFHPEERITNRDLARLFDTTDEWIQAHTGIVERRKAPGHFLASDLGVIALRRALGVCRWRKEEIDLLVCATSTPDTLVPSTACHIGHKLGISPPAFDVNAACAGFLYGLGVASPMIESGRYRRVALVAVDHYTRFTNYQDRTTAIFWGDAAACVLLQPDRPESGYELVDHAIGSMTEGTPYVRVPVRGFVEQDGAKVKQYAMRGFLESAHTVMDRNGVKPDQIAAFVGHQANYRLLQAVVAELGLDEDRHWHTVRTFGNTGAAGAPATLARWTRKRRLGDGDLVLMTVFGAGFTTASALLRCIQPAVRVRRRAGGRSRTAAS